MEIGKYSVIAELGRGGMGDVYLALAAGPAGFNKLVVVKALRADVGDESQFVSMFQDEARLAARLNHPNVVQTYEVGDAGGRHYFAMEYLEGQAFGRIITKLGPKLTLEMRLKILAEVCSGLEYAHELTDYDGGALAIVHRDVSPQNIFVTYEGHVKLLDFGVAKALGAEHQTESGVIKGRIRYMAPEQVLGDVDSRADLYSVGVLLWEAIADRRMWDGISDPLIMQRVLSGDVPKLEEIVPAAAPELVAICHKALAASPEDRYQTAGELQAALATYLSEHTSSLTTRTVGKVVAAEFAEERRRIRSAIDAKVKQVATAASSDVEILPLLSANDVDFGPSQDIVVTQPTPRPGVRTKRPIVAAVGAVLALGVVAFLTLKPHPTPPPAAANDGASAATTIATLPPPAPPPSAPMPAPVQVDASPLSSADVAGPTPPKPAPIVVARPPRGREPVSPRPTTPTASSAPTAAAAATRPDHVGRPKREIDTDMDSVPRRQIDPESP